MSKLKTIKTSNLFNLTEAEVEIIYKWLEIKRSPKTRKTYQSILKQFLLVVKKPLFSIDEDDLLFFKQWLSQHNYALSTIRNKLNCLKSLVSYMVRKKLIKHNYAVDLNCENPKDSLVERILTQDEVKNLLLGINNLRDKALFYLLYYGGLRVSEAVNLKWSDLVGNRLSVFGKGGKTRVITLHQSVMNLLNSWRENSPYDYIFVGLGNRSRGQKLSAVSAHRLIKKYAINSGVSERISCHWLRHAIASHLVLNNVPVTEIRDYLGHSSIAITDKYTKALKANNLTDFMPQF